MKRALLIPILSLFLIGTFFLATAWAQEPPERPLRMMLQGRFQEISLTDQQREELDKLRLEHQKEMVKLRADLQVLQLDLETLLDAKEPDKTKVYALIDKINNLRNEMTKKRIDFSLKRRTILTPEQWEKLKHLKKPLHPRRMFFRQRDRHHFPRLRGRWHWGRRWEE